MTSHQLVFIYWWQYVCFSIRCSFALSALAWNHLLISQFLHLDAAKIQPHEWALPGRRWFWGQVLTQVGINIGWKKTGWNLLCFSVEISIIVNELIRETWIASWRRSRVYVLYRKTVDGDAALNKVESDDFDALLAAANRLNSVCNFVKCKTLVKTLGANCPHCHARYGLSDLLPVCYGYVVTREYCSFSFYALENLSFYRV